MSPDKPAQEPMLVPDCTLDAFGLVCPMPVIKAAQKLKEMEFGQVLEIIADDEMIIDDMPAWCKSTGNLFLGYKEEDGEFKVYVRKKVIRSNR